MDPEPLERTPDKKVAFSLRTAGSGVAAVVANSHGLPAGISCPGRTRTCAGPSADVPTAELERWMLHAEAEAGGRGRETTWRQVLPQQGVDPTFPRYVVADLRRGTEENAAYRNWRALRSHLHDEEHLTAVLSATLAEFLSECRQQRVAPFYRVHWDGDIPTGAYARALRYTS